MTFIHWHALKREISSDSEVTDNPSKVTCEACLAYIEEHENA